MTSTSYIKGVRTRYRNSLESAVNAAKAVMYTDDGSDIDTKISKASKCIEKIKLYCDKVEIQSEKFASTFEESDSEQIEEVLADDCNLCSIAMDICFELQSFKDNLLLFKEKKEFKPEVSPDSNTEQLIELQKNMQRLFENQMKQSEKYAKLEKEKTHSVRLPKIDMITFSGDKTYWSEFWDSFQCSVHKNKSLSDVEKFNYLESKLAGEARAAIVGLSLSNENYEIAVDILQRRFGNKQEIVDLHYNKIINLKPANNDTKSLRYLLDNVQKHLRSLQVLGQNVQQDVFVSMIRSKIPSEVLVQLEIQKGSSDKWTVKILEEMLQEYVEACERARKATYSGGGRPGDSGSKSSASVKSGFVGTVNDEVQQEVVGAHALASTDVKEKKKYGPQSKKCCFCQASHWSDECDKFKTISERKAQIKGHCFRCLKKGHLYSECRTSKSCVYCGEMNVHHRSLCPKKFKYKNTMMNLANETENVECESEESGFMAMNEMVLMQTATTELKNPETNQAQTTRLLFDSGSHRSYISESLVKRLKLKSNGEQDIHVVTFGSTSSKKIKTKYVTLDIKVKSGNYIRVSANIVPVISGVLQRRPVKDLDIDHIQEKIRNVVLADNVPSEIESSPIEFLVGNDYYLDLILGDRIELRPGLYLLSSKLGWILSGRTSDWEKEQEYRHSAKEATMLIMTCGVHADQCSAVAALDSSVSSEIELQDLWNVESIGIVDKCTKTDDKIALDQFRDTIKFENNRYYVTWPWKSDKPELSSNRELAIGRLKTSVNRMKNRPDVFKKYNDVISDQFEKGIIEKVSGQKSDGKIHYIPHHAVITPQKATTKLRVVYDASAKTKQENLSLNDCLYRGPVMLNDLTGMLIRFRMNPIVLVADIEKAFLQIGLQRSQRDVTRFLWLKDVNDISVNGRNIQEYRFCRVPFGVISSPFLLGASVEYHLDSYDNPIAEKIKRDIYVDNLITGTKSVQEAVKLYRDSKQMFNEGSMNLREWISNSESVEAHFAESDKASPEETIKVLGHNWNKKSDSLGYKSPTIASNLTMSKRLILKHIASIFDPCGLICPIILRGKVLIQDLWCKEKGWDEPLSALDQEVWTKIESDIREINKICIPRYVSFEHQDGVESRLLCFCDASKRAYAAAVYLHQRCNGASQTKLIFAKTRLAPVKPLSIPRLELLAVLIGMKCVSFVKANLHREVVHSYLWTDSKCVLQWLKSEKQLTVFVRNRVTAIKEHKDVTVSYVPTKENPADIASRGATTARLIENEGWWNGPKWLKRSPHDWLFEYEVCENSKVECEKELSKSKNSAEVVLIQNSKAVKLSEIESENNVKEVSSPFGIDCNRFSSLTKLLRVTARVVLFVQKLRKMVIDRQTLTSEDIDEAERIWIRHIQKKHFSEALNSMDGKKTCSLVKQLGLFLDENGLIRCRGRMENACFSESARLPILLPKSDRFTHLLIEKIHKELLHSGVSQTLSRIRMRMWIPQGRQTVKSVLKSCSVCRRFEGGPYKMPPVCSFPKCRVTEASAFQRIGLDYLGPFLVKHEDERKVWICLFTCIVTRAIHLELVCDMTTSEFLLCFRRFIAQRGTPSQVISDNAMQFRAASNVLDKLWNNIKQDSELMNYVSDAGIKWSFNVELAPWMGGFYERLVGLVKRAMRKTIGRKLMTLVQLQTLVKEIEAVLNSRPLVYVGDDITSNIPLTPAHFLTPNPKTGIPNTEITDDGDYIPNETHATKLVSLWKKGQKLLDVFWQTWKNEYLTSLRERTQNTIRSNRISASFPPSENDVVIIKDDSPRGNWKFGKVVDLVKSRDGLVRSVKVLLPSGRILGRTINMLYPLEVCRNDAEEVKQSSKQSGCSEKKVKADKRKASIAAEKAIKKIQEEEKTCENVP